MLGTNVRDAEYVWETMTKTIVVFAQKTIKMCTMSTKPTR